MGTTEQAARAGAFRRIHTEGDPLVLVNAWDAISARIVEHAGAPAIATTSAGIAWSLGYADGEQAPVADVLGAIARIARVVRVPLSVDLERGYGSSPAELVRALLQLGVVGINIEDGTVPGTQRLVEPRVLAERIGAIRTVADRAGVALFVNARIDTHTVPCDDPRARQAETLLRARVYVDAGADGVFVPGLEALAEIEELARTVPRPLNVYVGSERCPSLADLRAAGVRRVSLGCGPYQAALACLQRIADTVLRGGSYEAMTAAMLPYPRLNQLVSQRQ